MRTGPTGALEYNTRPVSLRLYSSSGPTKIRLLRDARRYNAQSLHNACLQKLPAGARKFPTRRDLPMGVPSRREERVYIPNYRPTLPSTAN